MTDDRENKKSNEVHEQDLFSFENGEPLPLSKPKKTAKKSTSKKKASRKKIVAQPIEALAADEHRPQKSQAHHFGPKPPSIDEIAEHEERRLYGDKARWRGPSARVGYNVNIHVKGTLWEILGVSEDTLITLEMQEKVILKVFPFLNPLRVIRAPFALGFRNELYERAPKGVSKRALGECISRRINTISYQSMIAHYVQRRHLDGSPAELITEEESYKAVIFMLGFEAFSAHVGICPHDIARIVNWRRRRFNNLPTRIPRRLVRNRKEILAERRQKHEEQLAKAKADLQERQRENEIYGGKEKRKRKMRQEKQKALRQLEQYRENARQNEQAIREALERGERPPKVYVKHIYAEIQFDVRFNRSPTPKPTWEPVKDQEIYEAPKVVPTED